MTWLVLPLREMAIFTHWMTGEVIWNKCCEQRATLTVIFYFKYKNRCLCICDLNFIMSKCVLKWNWKMLVFFQIKGILTIIPGKESRINVWLKVSWIVCSNKKSVFFLNLTCLFGHSISFLIYFEKALLYTQTINLPCLYFCTGLIHKAQIDSMSCRDW